jgi:hypothetical protein
MKWENEVGNLYGTYPLIFQNMLCQLITKEECAAVKKILTLADKKKQILTFKKLLISQAQASDHVGFLIILRSSARDYGHLLSELEQKCLIHFYTSAATKDHLTEAAFQSASMLKDLWNMSKDEEGGEEEEEEDEEEEEEDFDLEKLQVQAQELRSYVEKLDVTSKPAKVSREFFLSKLENVILEAG